MPASTQSIDYISITSEEMITLGHLVQNNFMELNDIGKSCVSDVVVTLSKYLDNVALNQVVVSISSPNGNSRYRNILIMYRKTHLPDNIIQQRSKLYMALPSSKAIMTDDKWLYINVTGKRHDGRSIQGHFPSKGVYVRPFEFALPTGFFMHLVGSDTDDVVSFACKNEKEQQTIYNEIGEFLILYAGINKLLLSNQGKRYQPGQQLSKASKLAVTRSLPNNVVLRPVSLDINGYSDDLRKQSDGVTGIVKEWHCAAWGVRGHYRHYKSGKVVFINSYTKGKLRNQGVPGREYDLHNCCK